MKMTGTALVGIGNSSEGSYKIPGVLDAMLQWVDDVLTALDTLIVLKRRT
jgi:hypothetical protein